MKKTIEIAIDEEIAESAERVYKSIGMDTEMAVSMFIRRTAMLGAMPMNLEPVQMWEGVARAVPPYSASPVPRAQPDGAVQGRKITQEMVESVWDAFLEMRESGSSPNAMTEKVVEASGMTPGSAFIYLVILENLEAGKPNTRNMKFRDLEFFMGRIRETLGEAAYAKALASLEASLEYWDDPKFGQFAQRVREYIQQH